MDSPAQLDIRGRVVRYSPAVSQSWTHAQALRAIYIDFEGNQDREPSFIGVRPAEASSFQQVVLEEALWPAALAQPRREHHAPAGYVNQIAVTSCRTTATLPVQIEMLLARCEAEDRHMVAWSRHELNVVEEYLPHLVTRFAAVFRDGKVPAKKWKRRFTQM